MATDRGEVERNDGTDGAGEGLVRQYCAEHVYPRRERGHDEMSTDDELEPKEFNKTFRAGMDGTKRKNSHVRVTHRGNKKIFFGDGNARHQYEQSVRNMVDRAKLIIENTSSVRSVVANGHWNVPVEERPKGWEKMGVPEK